MSTRESMAETIFGNLPPDRFIHAFEGNSNVYFFEGSYSEYEENRKKRLGDEGPKRIRHRKLM